MLARRLHLRLSTCSSQPFLVELIHEQCNVRPTVDRVTPRPASNDTRDIVTSACVVSASVSAIQQVMSLSCDTMTSSAEYGGTTTRSHAVPLLRPDGDAPYSVWRPQMETCLMRCGVQTRDYTVETKNWNALVAAVEGDAADEETAAIDRLLGNAGVDDASSSKQKKEVKVQSGDRKLVAAIVSRSRYAFGLLYAALTDDIRALIEKVPPGYAFGLWSLLEDRFQSKRSDNVADHWMQYMNLAQEQGELYDSYMARVDKITTILEGAGQLPPSGMRQVMLLHRLQPMYKPATLALVASGRVSEEKAVDWSVVKTFMQDYERAEIRGNDPSLSGDGDGRAMAAFRSSFARQGRGGSNGSFGSSGRTRDMSKVQCYECDEFGHMARDCDSIRLPKKHTGSMDCGNGRVEQRGGNRGRHSSQQEDSNDEEDERRGSARSCEQVFALGRVRGGIVEVSSEEETEGDTQASKRPNEKNRTCAKVAAGRRTESNDRGSSTVSRRERQGLAQKEGAMRSAEESTDKKRTMSVSNLSRLNQKQVTSRQTVQHAHISRTIGPNVQVPMNAMGTMESGDVGGIQEEFAHEEMCWDLSELIQDIEAMRILDEVRDTGAREGKYLLVSGDSTAQ